MRRRASRKADIGEADRDIFGANIGANYAPDEIEFMNAMDQYKRDNRRPWPAWSEVLQVLKSLGYRKE